MNAVLIAVGDELLSGKTLDTNSAYLADRLLRLGIRTDAHWTVGDRADLISRAICDAAELADVVLVTGGLGPTPDDLTRQALADAMGVELVLDKDSLRRIEAFFRKRNYPMAPTNRVQAMLPAGAEPLPNPVGTAPGMAAAVGEAVVFVMPGVPAEMERMFAEQVAPRLPRPSEAMAHRTLRLYGIGESSLAHELGDLLTRDKPVVVGTTASAGLVSIHLTAHAADADAADARVAERCQMLRDRLGTRVIGTGDDTMSSVVGQLLRSSGRTLATAESCTGGYIGRMLTSVSGSSDYYLGGFVTYANRLKVALLGVPAGMLAEHGAVSEPVARAMAEGCRERLAADYALAATGIAGPTGGTKAKPVGLVFIALAGPDGTQVEKQIFTGHRDRIRQRAALAALDCLRLALV